MLVRAFSVPWHLAVPQPGQCWHSMTHVAVVPTLGKELQIPQAFREGRGVLGQSIPALNRQRMLISGDQGQVSSDRLDCTSWVGKSPLILYRIDWSLHFKELFILPTKKTLWYILKMKQKNYCCQFDWVKCKFYFEGQEGKFVQKIQLPFFLWHTSIKWALLPIWTSLLCKVLFLLQQRKNSHDTFYCRKFRHKYKECTTAEHTYLSPSILSTPGWYCFIHVPTPVIFF